MQVTKSPKFQLWCCDPRSFTRTRSPMLRAINWPLRFAARFQWPSSNFFGQTLSSFSACHATTFPNISLSQFMDAHNHLKRLGWKGSGYSLGRSNSGITKPILISHKTDFLGLGARQQKEKQADQWWLRAFDNALQAFGTDKQVR